MILKETLRKIVQSQKQEMGLRNIGIKRELLEKVSLSVPHAIIISGIRRCGKSTLLRQIMKGIKSYNYFNFEDSRAIGFEISDFEKLDEVFIEENNGSDYYFFDEVQNIDGWERFVRRLLDNKKKCIITGSNASLLSKELGTKLTGRHLTYELFPFSYNEMLSFTGLKPSLLSFVDYFKKGGLPEFVEYGKNEMLQELFEDVLVRDVIARHRLKEPKVVKQLALFLLTNIGKKVSYNKLREYLNLGSPNTAISYVGFFEDGYLFFVLPKFDYSFRKQLIGPKKIYAIDTGLANANSASFSEDNGRILENIVFLHLRRNYKRIFYFSGKQECDFIIVEKDKVRQAIQACYELNEENKDREINGLIEAMVQLKLKEGLILTYSQDDHFAIQGMSIIVKPVWKWLLE